MNFEKMENQTLEPSNKAIISSENLGKFNLDNGDHKWG